MSDHKFSLYQMVKTPMGVGRIIGQDGTGLLRVCIKRNDAVGITVVGPSADVWAAESVCEEVK